MKPLSQHTMKQLLGMYHSVVNNSLRKEVRSGSYLIKLKSHYSRSLSDYNKVLKFVETLTKAQDFTRYSLRAIQTLVTNTGIYTTTRKQNMMDELYEVLETCISAEPVPHMKTREKNLQNNLSIVLRYDDI